MFVSPAYACLFLVLVTDLAYWRTANLLWLNFSTWLLLAGLLFGGVAVLAGIIDLFRPRTRIFRPFLTQIVTFLVVLLLAVLSSFVHAADGWTAILPYGLPLSAAIVALILLSLFLGRSSARFATTTGRHVHG